MKNFYRTLTAALLLAWLISPLGAQEVNQEAVQELTTDVCVIGAGSAGCAAAITAAREGAQVVLIEKDKILGGTGSNAYVSNWEGGPGCNIAEELFERMHAAGGAGVGKETDIGARGAFGIKMVTDSEPYEISLVRALPPEGGYRSIVFLPEAFDKAARDMMAETGRVTLLDETTYIQPEKSDDGTRVLAVLAKAADGRMIRVQAKVFIDSTGSVILCRDLGCESRLGPEPQSEYNESLAPKEPKLTLNAITRCYRIDPKENPKREVLDENQKTGFPKCAYVTGWLDGPRMVNMMPTLPGKDLVELGYDECMKRSEVIVHNHWNWLQTQPGFENYELTALAPELGIRESYRIVTQYVLNQADLEATWPNQEHNDMIAVADHPCDIHGEGGGLVHVKFAYGIPYRCLIPKSELTNLLVACRGAGLSRVAAASCRLQRTMIQFGNAAGVAAAWAARDNVPVDKIDVDALVKKMDARKRYPK
ncbi:MAG: FAD-dependent oxidoreductase [Planctomycetia bacterium]|nr:FAD-dependent oxidoreductase [Planctomycetia bacterium]